jgi:hypothetical protein
MEEVKELEVIEGIGRALESIERATIDVQIATAHQYPRSITLFKNRAMEMVTLDEETAQSCIYRRPVGKEGRKVIYAEGKSIRMAEIVGSCYGNLRVGAILIEQTDRYVKGRGLAHDLESNFASSAEVIESTVNKDGRPYSERMRMVVAKACLAKARRDATFQVVPGALCKTLEDAARKTAIGTTKTIGKRRTLVMDWINKSGIDSKRVFDALGIGGIEDIGVKELETLTGIKTAIKDKDIAIEEAFPREAISMPVVEDPSPKDKPKNKKQNLDSDLPELDDGLPEPSEKQKLAGDIYLLLEKLFPNSDELKNKLEHYSRFRTINGLWTLEIDALTKIKDQIKIDNDLPNFDET